MQHCEICKTFSPCWNITAALQAIVTLRYSGISQPFVYPEGTSSSSSYTSHGCLEFPMDPLKYMI